MSLDASLTRLKAAADRLAATMARLREVRMRSALASEASILPRWRAHNVRVHKTTFMRGQMGEPEVQLLQKIISAPMGFDFAQTMARKNELRKR